MKYLLQNKNWKFCLGDEEDAWRMDFDDSGWRDVELPHDWSVEYPFSRDYSSGTGYVRGGVGWYRHSFFLPEDYRGKKTGILFDGIYKNSTIWVNGCCVGGHPYGYTTFLVDISDIVRPGETNGISVRVNQSETSDSRWFTGAGITRKAGLVIQEPVHTMIDGVFFSTVWAGESQAEVSVQWEVENSSTQDQNIEIRSRLRSQNSKTVLELSAPMEIRTGEKRAFKKSALIQNPFLWSDDRPYLYTLETEIRTEHDGWYTADTRKVGIREVKFDPEKGMSVNGRPKKLKGVCIHHDAGCLGAAVTKAVWKRRLEKLKDMGCNALRMSHNPHMPELYELCDEMGFYVMDEAFDEWENPKNKWRRGHNVYPPGHEGYYKYFHQWHKEDLQAMIRRDRSHPCVIIWSVGNELDYPNDPYCHPLFKTMTGNNDANKPAEERQYNPGKPNAERLPQILSMLLEEAKEADDTRPVTVAAAFPELTAQIGFLDGLDVVGYNYKENLYEEHHRKFPGKVFLGSETDHGKEAYDAAQRPYICGQFLWTGVDYMGEALGWTMRGSSAGLLTMAGWEKPGYYRRKALWSERPFARILIRRYGTYDTEMGGFGENWNYRPDEETEVRCYTNIREIHLCLNGESVGEPEKREKEYLSWRLPFVPGTISAVDEKGRTWAEAVTTSVAVGLTVKLWESGSAEDELLQFEVTAVDQNGYFVETASDKLSVCVEGGDLRGIENGDLYDVTDYTSDSRRLYKGRMIVYVRKDQDAQTVSVRISGEYVGEHVLTVSAQA